MHKTVFNVKSNQESAWLLPMINITYKTRFKLCQISNIMSVKSVRMYALYGYCLDKLPRLQAFVCVTILVSSVNCADLHSKELCDPL